MSVAVTACTSIGLPVGSCSTVQEERGFGNAAGSLSGNIMRDDNAFEARGALMRGAIRPAPMRPFLA